MLRVSPRARLAALPLLAALAAAGCSSPPSRLYLLSAVTEPGAAPSASASGARTAASGSTLPRGSGEQHGAPLVGVSVSVPEYLDRLDIVERTSANELKPDYSAQWGENLGVTATRAVVEDLIARLPSDDVVIFPSRSARSVDYVVRLDLTRFEMDAQRRSVLAGRWSIADKDGRERASGRVQHAEPVEQEGYTAMAAAMSRNLAAASTEIAAALQRLPR